MPAAKRRKVTIIPSSTTPSSVGTITAFTKVSKPQLISKWPHELPACSTDTQLVGRGNLGNKRKLFKVEETNIDNGDESLTTLCSGINQSQSDVKLLQGRRSKEYQRLPQTPNKPNLDASIPGSVNTPTKGARALLDGLVLSSPSSRKLPSSSPRSSSSTISKDNIPSSCEEQVDKIREKLPTELLDLINLNASFLTALSLHHAHNGADNPADLRLLCPDVARAWGKRKVLLADIQRTLGILNNATADDDHGRGWPPGRLCLSDYGHGKICVEAKISTGRGKVARPLDENRLNDMFRCNLQKIWDEQQSIVGISVSKFIQDLPVEAISVCSSLAKMSPLLAKGQQRLEDLKAGIILKKQAQRDRGPGVQITDENGRKQTLLERLKAKELRQSTLPAPPSKAQLSRNAAFHRLGEVVSVLSLLTTSTSVGQQRVSFTLPTILGKLRDSFKTPISKEEGEICVRLLASEITPEWLKIIRMGKVDAVVVNRDNRPSDLDIKERVRHAI